MPKRGSITTCTSSLGHRVGLHCGGGGGVSKPPYNVSWVVVRPRHTALVVSRVRIKAVVQGEIGHMTKWNIGKSQTRALALGLYFFLHQGFCLPFFLS